MASVLISSTNQSQYPGCIGDDAYIASATRQAASIQSEAVTWVALQAALMLAQRLVTTSITDMQAGLANRRLTMAQEALAQAQKTWVKEKALVTETMAEAVNVTQYGSAQSMLVEMDLREDMAIDSSETRAARLGLTIGNCDDARIKRGMATARTDLVSHAMRAAEARTLALNDRRYSRQLSVIALGKNKLQNAIGIGRISDVTGNGVRDSLINTINSGMSLWGYSNNRWRGGTPYSTGVNAVPRVVYPTVSPFDRSAAPSGITINQTINTQAATTDGADVFISGE